MLKHLKSINLQDFHLNSVPEKKEINYLPGNNIFPFEDKQTPTHSPGARNFYWFCGTLRAFNWKMSNFSFFMRWWAGKKKPTSRRLRKIANKSFSAFSCIIKVWFMQSLSRGFLVYADHILMGRNGFGLISTRLLHLSSSSSVIINFLEDHKREYQRWLFRHSLAIRSKINFSRNKKFLSGKVCYLTLCDVSWNDSTCMNELTGGNIKLSSTGFAMEFSLADFFDSIKNRIFAFFPFIVSNMFPIKRLTLLSDVNSQRNIRLGFILILLGGNKFEMWQFLLFS